MKMRTLFAMVFLAVLAASHIGMAKSLDGLGLSKTLKCDKGALNLDLMTDTFVPRDSYDAHIYGTYYTTEPFKEYKIEFSPKILEGVMSAKMPLFKKGEGFASQDGSDPSEIHVNNVFEVSPRVKGIYIEVSKSFNFGDRYVEFFWVNFKDIDIANSLVEPNKISVCLEPQIYD